MESSDTRPVASYQSILEVLSCIAMIDPAGQAISWCHFDAFLSYQPSDIVSWQDLAQIIHPGDFAAFQEAVMDGSDQESAKSMRVVDKNGSWEWVNYRVYPFQESAGNPNPGCLVILMPLAGLKTFTRALLENETKYRALVRQAPVGIIIFNQAGAILEWNHQMEQITGFSYQEVQKTTVWNLGSFILVDNQGTLTGNKIDEPLSRWVNQHQIDAFDQLFTLDFQAKNGSRRWINFLVFQIPNHSEPLAGAVVTDITEQHQAELRVQQQIQQAEAVARFSSQVNVSLEIDTLLGVACKEIALSLQVTYAVAQLYDRQTDSFLVYKVYGENETTPTAHLHQPVNRTMFLTLREMFGPVLILPDVRNFPDVADPGIVENVSLRTVIITGMEYEGNLVGLLTIATTGQVRTFTQDELRLLVILANQCAQAVAHSQLYQAAQRQARYLKTLNEITRIGLNSRNSYALLSSVVKKLVETMSAEGCYIFLRNAQDLKLRPKAAYGAAADIFLTMSPQPGQWPFNETGYDEEDHGFLNDLADMGANSSFSTAGQTADKLVSLPLRVDESTIGFLLLRFKPAHEPFTSEDILQLEEITANLSLGLHKILLLEHEQRRREEAEKLQKAMAELANSGLAVSQIYKDILSLLATLVRYESACLVIFEEDQFHIVERISYIPGLDQALDTMLMSDGEYIHQLIHNRTPTVFSDIQSYPMFSKIQQGYPSLKSWIGIPLIAYSQRIGYLSVFSHRDEALSKDKMTMLQSFAHQAAVTLEKARLYEQVHNGRERLQLLSRKLVEAQESERRAMSRELHDEIGQELTALIFSLDFAKQLNGEVQLKLLTEAQSAVQRLMNEVREMSLKLRPGLLDDLGLDPALTWLFQRFESQTGIHVNATLVNLKHRWDSEIETAAFRITQEALTNVARYAGVNEINAYAGFENGRLDVIIEDEGKGFDLAILENYANAIGLSGMIERASLVGGQLEIRSEPGKGTSIRALLPAGRPIERRQNERQSIPGR